MKTDKSRIKGSILVFVLALIVFISVLSVRLMKETTQELKHASQFYYRDDLRTYAYSALDLVVGVINEFKVSKGKLEADQAWVFPVRYAQDYCNLSLSQGVFGNEVKLGFEVSIIPEWSKFPLHDLKDNSLASLFSTYVNINGGGGFDMLEEDGRPFMESFKDWEDDDNEEREDGAEVDYYDRLNPNYFPPNSKIESLREFQWIKGFGKNENYGSGGIFFDEIGAETQGFKMFQDSFSILNRTMINPVNCSVSLLRTLARDEKEFSDLMEARNDPEDQKYFYQLVNEMISKYGIRSTMEVKVFRVLVKVNRGKSFFKLNAIFSTDLGSTNRSSVNRASNNKNSKELPRSDWNKKYNYPFRVLAITEN